jgi:hypothetical protein
MENKINICLTTISLRYYLLEKTLKNLLNQIISANITVFYSNEGFLFDEGIPDEKINYFKKLFLCINFIKVPNIGSFRKLIYALKYYPNSIIITVDDDTIYDNQLVEKMLNEYNKYKCIICGRARLYNFEDSKTIEELEMIDTCNEELLNILPEGSGGILYHSSFFDDNFINDDYKRDIFTKNNYLLLKNDDIYFRYYTLKKNIKVKKININYTTKYKKMISLFNNCNKKLIINKELFK